MPAVPRAPVSLGARVVTDMVHKVRYRGSASSVGVLDSLLRDQGLRVEHREIAEEQGRQQELVDIVVYVHGRDGDGALGGSSDALIIAGIENAIAKLRASVPRAQAQIVVTRNHPSQHSG